MTHDYQARVISSFMVNKLPLMGSYEIRTRLGGVSRQRAYQIASQPNFPEPVAELEMGKVWHRDDVEAWIKKYRPHLVAAEPPVTDSA